MEKLKNIKDWYMELNKRGKIIVISAVVIAVVVIIGYF
tara:strand:+ start:324 stop:437 length:114 start_codon:yes stop_codon:yes gene_type:complete